MVNVPAAEQPSFRTRKGEIATNVLDVCDTKEDFVYVLAGYEGYVVESRILQDALDRENGLQMPKGIYNFNVHYHFGSYKQNANRVSVFGTGYYYVCDVGYPNAKGFLAPYRGQRYHLQDWWGDGNAPTTAKEYFNMKHSLAINVIECAFVVLKDRWAILRGKSYYPL